MMKKSNIILIVLVVAVVVVYFVIGKADTGVTLESVSNTEASEETRIESVTEVTDYNSSQSDGATDSSINAVDQNCTGPDCAVLDDDSDGDVVPTDDADAQAQYDGYIKIDDIKGETRED